MVQNLITPRTYGEKNQGRGKILIFSSSSAENGRGRGKDFARGRGRGGRVAASEDRDEATGYRKTFRSKGYDKDYSSDNLNEEGRIGRQLRLLSRETDEDVICKICQQLQVSRYFH